MPPSIIPANLLVHLQKHFTLEWESDYMAQFDYFNVEMSQTQFSIQHASATLVPLAADPDAIIKAVLHAIDEKAHRDRQIVLHELMVANEKRLRATRICSTIFVFTIVVLVVFVVLGTLHVI
jgi:hypothetical protein